ncbi:hypothetical protein WR25_02315 [Diploscapter pachys]|uniref:C2H2-type domain-containing protein n=1 Tax=Diploscapter pachys TaxID=2018661 RepID=A0A2A2LC84_9BILA|nr:hypothetical protein WR25_02315 [Diploscapter pachys]
MLPTPSGTPERSQELEEEKIANSPTSEQTEQEEIDQNQGGLDLHDLYADVTDQENKLEQEYQAEQEEKEQSEHTEQTGQSQVAEQRDRPEQDEQTDKDKEEDKAVFLQTVLHDHSYDAYSNYIRLRQMGYIVASPVKAQEDEVILDVVGGDVDVSDTSQEFSTSCQLDSSMPLHSPDPIRFVPSPWLNSNTPHTPQSLYSPYARPAGFGSGVHHFSPWMVNQVNQARLHVAQPMTQRMVVQSPQSWMTPVRDVFSANPAPRQITPPWLGPRLERTPVQAQNGFGPGSSGGNSGMPQQPQRPVYQPLTRMQLPSYWTQQWGRTWKVLKVKFRRQNLPRMMPYTGPQPVISIQGRKKPPRKPVAVTRDGKVIKAIKGGQIRNRFKCRKCGILVVGGYFKEHAQRHLLIDENFASFQCPYDNCDMAHYRKSAVGTHISRCHRNEKESLKEIIECIDANIESKIKNMVTNFFGGLKPEKLQAIITDQDEEEEVDQATFELQQELDMDQNEAQNEQDEGEEMGDEMNGKPEEEDDDDEMEEAREIAEKLDGKKSEQASYTNPQPIQFSPLAHRQIATPFHETRAAKRKGVDRLSPEPSPKKSRKTGKPKGRPPKASSMMTPSEQREKRATPQPIERLSVFCKPCNKTIRCAMGSIEAVVDHAALHMKELDGKLRFKCKHCNRSNSSENQMRFHCRKKHSDPQGFTDNIQNWIVAHVRHVSKECFGSEDFLMNVLKKSNAFTGKDQNRGRPVELGTDAEQQPSTSRRAGNEDEKNKEEDPEWEQENALEGLEEGELPSDPEQEEETMTFDKANEGEEEEFNDRLENVDDLE